MDRKNYRHRPFDWVITEAKTKQICDGGIYCDHKVQVKEEQAYDSIIYIKEE